MIPQRSAKAGQKAGPGGSIGVTSPSGLRAFISPRPALAAG
jgi:hypothetical protein